MDDLPADVREEAVGQGGDNNGEDPPPRKLSLPDLVENTGEILTAISKRLSIKTLKKFRLVSHTFYESSLPPWREKTVLRVNFNPAISDMDDPRNKGMLPLGIAVNVPVGEVDMLKLTKYPYTQLQIFQWDYRAYDNEAQRTLINEFFITWRPILRDIDLRKCTKSVGYMRMIQALKCANMLTHLAFNGCVMGNHGVENARFVENARSMENGREITDTLGLTVTHLTIDAIENTATTTPHTKCFNILSHLPLLQELTLYIRCSLVARFYEPERELMGCLRSFRDRFGNDQLRIKIRGGFVQNFEGTIDALLETTLPFEHAEAFVLPRLFQDCLRQRARNLRTLILNHFLRDRTLNVYLPEFPYEVSVPGLKKIYMFGRVTNSFNFLNFMPALETVVMRLPHRSSKKDGDNQDFMDNTLEAYKTGVTMQHLTHLDVESYFEQESLPVLKRMIPNLTILKMVVQSNDMFSFICDNWRNLVRFIVHPGSKVDDKGITGLDGEGDLVRQPNLTNLNVLQRFEIWSKLPLTDLSVDQSFLRVNSLTMLVIHTPVNFSVACRAKIDEKFGTWQPDLPTSSDPTCCILACCVTLGKFVGILKG